jgi:HEAT repeat protein
MSRGIPISSEGPGLRTPRIDGRRQQATAGAATRLVARLQNLHSGARALPLIVSLGDAAVPALESFLRGPSQAIYHPRARAADALGAIASESAIAALIRALRDCIAREPEPLCREAEGVIVSRIAERLSRHRSAVVVEALLDALRARPYPTCARALGEMGDSRAIPLLIECLHEDAARDAATAALLRFNGAAVVRLRAVLAMPRVISGIEPPTWIDGRAAAATLLATLGDSRSLIRALDDQQRSVRLAAAIGLVGRVGAVSERALDVVLQGLDDPDWSRAQSIMQVLEPLGASITNALESILEDHATDEASKRRHRRAAVLAGRLGLLAAAPDLAALSSADDPQLRIAAIDALTQMAGSGDHHLARFLSDPAIDIAARALFALNVRGQALGAVEIYRWLGRIVTPSSPWPRWWRTGRLLAAMRRARSTHRS